MFKSRITAVVIVVGLASVAMAALAQTPQATATASPARSLAGDPRAVAAAERMIERLGGREVWSRAHTLHVEYDGWRTTPSEPVVERAWRNLRAPFQRSEYEGRSFYTISALSPSESWTSRDGTLSVAAPEQHQGALERYPFGFYTSLHTMAAADPRIRLEWREPNQVVVRSHPDGKERAWWVIDNVGGLVKWGALRPTGGTVEYVYGPMRSFGNINFPEWGASVDGWWRWKYTVVDLSTDPFTASVARPKG